jgi:hypothetical protein
MVVERIRGHMLQIIGGVTLHQYIFHCLLLSSRRNEIRFSVGDITILSLPVLIVRTVGPVWGDRLILINIKLASVYDLMSLNSKFAEVG